MAPPASLPDPSRTELEGFGVDQATKKEQRAEATEQTANMMAMERYPGFQGRFFSMPARNVVPKPTYRIGTAGGFEVPMKDLTANTLGTAVE